MRLKSKSKWPPGGWQYRQPETGWEAPTPMSDNYEQTKSKIAAMRRNNPRFNLPSDDASVDRDLETFTVHRLGFDPTHCYSDDPNEEKKTSSLQVTIGRAVARHAGRGANLLSGGRILNDWLGSGGQPVEPDLSATRARICEDCPCNDMDGDWLSKVTSTVAEAILEQRRLKTALDITVPNEDKIGTCECCGGCHLPLKVHVPITHIRKQMNNDQLAELDPRCWILHEP